jgi:hypothetical protein
MTVVNARYVNWFEEEMHITYGDDNDGLIHGIYVYDDSDDLCHVEWFKTEAEARQALLTI